MLSCSYLIGKYEYDSYSDKDKEFVYICSLDSRHFPLMLTHMRLLQFKPVLTALVLICAGLLTSDLQAQSNSTKSTVARSIAEDQNTGVPTVGLVLEGGGALGFAHVGVIKVLEEERIPVHSIAGTSMGSIVGAAYASGRTIKELEDVLSNTDWDALFNESVPRDVLNYRLKAGRDGEIFGDSKFALNGGEIITALVEGQKIEPLFQQLFGKVPANTSFDDLPIPFRAVAADVETGDAVVLDHGSLAMAARASMSVPGFFSPVELDGRLLVDGGISDNFPVEVARSMNPDALIGVEFKFEALRRDQLTSPLAISGQIPNLFLERTTANSRALMRPGDVMIYPIVTGFTATSFASATEIMKTGEDAARKLVPQL